LKDKEIENDASKVSGNAKFWGQSDDLLQYPSSLCYRKVRLLDFDAPISPFEPPLRDVSVKASAARKSTSARASKTSRLSGQVIVSGQASFSPEIE
jgi:hypothetical protein